MIRVLFMDINGFYSGKIRVFNIFVPLNEILNDIHGQFNLLVVSWNYIKINYSWFDPYSFGYSELFLFHAKPSYCTKKFTYGVLKVFKLVALLGRNLFYWQVVSKLLIYFDSLALFITGQKAVNVRYFDRELKLSVKHSHT